MTEDTTYIKPLNAALKTYLKDAVRVTIKNPSQALFFARMLRAQKKATRTRQAWERQGLHVPPFLIASITNRCNLRCKGCYAQAHAQTRSPRAEMSEDKLWSVFDEARELGISAILLAGGEPFVRQDLMVVTRDFPELMFPVVTNGTLLDDTLIHQLKQQRNVWPVLSIEGHEHDTNQRRGDAIYQRVQRAMSLLKENDVFFGCSLTVTRSNIHTITDRGFIQSLIDKGCRLFFFVEYVSIAEDTKDWVLTDEQRAELLATTEDFRSTLPGLFIAFPGDEEQFGGCLAAGRGFVHISPEGNLEPCPFSPYSDTSLRDISLKEGLQSPLLQAIRQNYEQLSETAGGCALWTEREWVRSLLPAPVATKAGAIVSADSLIHEAE
ncbi:MAG: radical SAM protein [Euryarchaeota archaeon]|nr:radical SAM protein [Euryarchaeota archaeon]